MANNLAVATSPKTRRVALLKKQELELPKGEWVLTTPGQAQLWVDTAAPNRNVIRRKVDLYANIMKRNDWLKTGEPIVFDEEGKNIDGQHRLLGCIKADVPVWLYVITGVKRRAQLVMDQGAKRAPHDQIRLREGIECQPIHIAVAKAMLTSIGVGMEQRRVMLTDIQVMDRYYMKHRQAVEFAVTGFWGGKQTVKGVTIAPVFAPVARAWYSQDHEALRRFIEVVCKGSTAEGVGSRETAAVVLRNWLLGGREGGVNARARGDRYVIYKKAEIALDAFLNGRSIQRLAQMRLEYEMYPIPGDKKEKDDDAK